MRRFLNRNEAGEALAQAVAELRLPRPVVLALPRGGAPVAAPVAEILQAPLDLLMVRKIRVPGRPELAAGAVVNGVKPQTVWNRDVLDSLGLDKTELASEVEFQLGVIDERRRVYLQGRPSIDVEGQDAVLVDDGIATGATAKAALKALELLAPASVTLATPVAPSDTVTAFECLVDRFLCLLSPVPFLAVGQGYIDFGQTSDSEVIACLRNSAGRMDLGDGR